MNKIIEDTKSERRVIWSSSDATGQKQLEDENPDVGFIFSQREILIIYALYYFGFLRNEVLTSHFIYFCMSVLSTEG